MRIITILLLASTLIACGGESVNQSDERKHWSSFEMDHMDPITGIRYTYDGEPQTALTADQIREIYYQVQEWMGIPVFYPPHIVYTDTGYIYVDGQPNRAYIFYNNTNLIVVNAERPEAFVKEATCHEFVHHVYNKGVGYGSDMPLQDEHDSPYYRKCWETYVDAPWPW